MPKIKRLTFSNPITRELAYLIDANYSVKQKKFYASLPEDLHGYIMGLTNEEKNKYCYSWWCKGPSNNSLELLEVNLKTLIEDFLTVDIKCTKVILYQLAYKLPATAFNPQHKFGAPKIAGFTFAEGIPTLALGIDFIVIYRVEIGASVRWSSEPYIPGRTNSVDLRVEPPQRFYTNQFLVYTPEMEEWFVSTTERFQKMIKGVLSFFGESREELIANIKRNDLKLLNQ